MSTETPLQQAERHVREGEERIARQEQIVSEMEQDGDATATNIGRQLLAVMHGTLTIARSHLELERRKAARKKGPSHVR